MFNFTTVVFDGTSPIFYFTNTSGWNTSSSKEKFIFYISVSQKFLSAEPFWLQKITTGPQIFAHVYTQGVPEGMCQTSGECFLS